MVSVLSLFMFFYKKNLAKTSIVCQMCLEKFHAFIIYEYGLLLLLDCFLLLAYSKFKREFWYLTRLLQFKI